MDQEARESVELCDMETIKYLENHLHFKIVFSVFQNNKSRW